MELITALLGPALNFGSSAIEQGGNVFNYASSRRSAILNENQRQMDNQARNKAMVNAAVVLLIGVAVIYLAIKKL